MDAIQHRLIGKCVVKFLAVSIELFSLAVTANVPRANIEYEQVHGLFTTAECITLVYGKAHSGLTISVN